MYLTCVPVLSHVKKEETGVFQAEKCLVFFVLQLLDVDPQDNVCLYLFDVPCTQFRRYTDHNTRKNIVQSIDGM